MLEDAPLSVERNEEAAHMLARGVAALGVDKLPWSRELRRLQGRAMFLRKMRGNAFPDLSDRALAAGVAEWLAPHLLGKTGVDEIGAEDLSIAFQSLLPFDLRRQIDVEAPAIFQAPSGSRVPIDYSEEGASLSIRVQELFGLAQHPRVAAGRVPIVLHLLSPAHRPIQVTTDLPGFWRGSWKEVRAELRGRYPKHAWPEDPLSALPTSRAKPRGRPA
jgi:ATP-dependent helicase HrpB